MNHVPVYFFGFQVLPEQIRCISNLCNPVIQLHTSSKPFWLPSAATKGRRNPYVIDTLDIRPLLCKYSGVVCNEYKNSLFPHTRYELSSKLYYVCIPPHSMFQWKVQVSNLIRRFSIPAYTPAMLTFQDKFNNALHPLLTSRTSRK